MNSGWLIENEGGFALWSGFESVQMYGIHKSRNLDARAIRLVAGLDYSIVAPLNDRLGVYFSSDGVRWSLSKLLPNFDAKNKPFLLNAESGTVSYIENRRLQILSREGSRSVCLPDMLVTAACPTECGDWIVVGCDEKKDRAALNERAVARILPANTEKWLPYNVQLGSIQRFLVSKIYPIAMLSSLDVYRHPRIFLGDPQCLDDFSYESLLVEVESGSYRVARFGVAEIYGFGRDIEGVPYCTTILGEYKSWNGHRFKSLRWRNALVNLFRDVEVTDGRAFLDVYGETVRGIYECSSSHGVRKVYPFASDDFGRTWFRPTIPLEMDGWNVVKPFVRKGYQQVFSRH